MKRSLLVAACVLMLFLTYTAASYLRVEWITWRHASEFKQTLETLYPPGAGSTATLLKVFQYDGQHATLYLLLRNTGMQAIYLHLVKNTKWEEDKQQPPKLIWSSGSADGWTWPPYWH